MSTPSIVSPVFTPRIQEVLNRLYANTIEHDPKVRASAHRQGVDNEHHPSFYHAMKDAYMPVTPDFGNLLYMLARNKRSRTIVEFGTSFGISTIFLAAALRDNNSQRGDHGGSKLITTEYEPGKAQCAQENLIAAGLDDLVEVRVGDAIMSLAHHLPPEIDLVFLDGAKTLYLDVMRMLEPHLVSGSVIASDNSDMEGAAPYLDYVRNPDNGYICSAVFSKALGAEHRHDIAVRW